MRPPGPAAYLRLLERSAAAVDVPVIASLNGLTPGSFAAYAHSMQDAGAAAIELNIYYVPGDPQVSGRDVEAAASRCAAVGQGSGQHSRRRETEPLLQLHREMAPRLDAAGADGLVLFNRFLQPDVDPREADGPPRGDAVRPGRGAPGPRLDLAARRPVQRSLAATTGVDTRRCRQVLAGGRRRRDDGVGAAASRHGACAGAAGRTAPNGCSARASPPSATSAACSPRPPDRPGRTGNVVTTSAR